MSAHPFKLAPVALASALAIGALAPNAAFAQSTSASPSAEANYSVNLPAEPLGNALNELARQAGLQLLVSRELVAGKLAPAVTGRLTVRQALDRLLAGSGLVASMDGTAVVVRASAPAPDARSEAVLPTVNVTAESDRGVVPYVARETQSLGFKLPEQKTPAVINTVTEEFWEATGSKTLDEVLSFVPGVSLTDNGGWTGDTISIRGFTSSVPYRDGIRQVDSGYGQSLRAMPDNIERIEVVKTLRTITLGVGQDGYRKLGADLTGKLNEAGDVQGRLVLAYVEPEEWRAGRPDNTLRYLVAPTLNWDYSAQGKVTVGYERSHQKSPQDRGIIFLEGAWPGGFAPREWSFHQTTSNQVNETDRLRLNHEHRFNDALTWSTSIEHGKYSYRLQEFRNADSEPGWGTLYNDDGRSWSGSRLMNLYWDNWSGDTTANALRSTLDYKVKAGRTDHTISIGIDRFSSTNLASSLYSNISNTFDILAPINNQAPAFLDKNYALWTSTIKVKEQGVSAKWLADWSEKFRTIVGVRQFDYTYDYDAAYVDYQDAANNYPYVDAYGSKKTSLRVAGSYDLSPNHTAFVGASDGYVPQTGIKRDGSPLDPIHDQALEVGIKSRLLGGKLAWTNSLFTIRRSNASLQDPTNGPNDSFVVNGGKSKITGFESELTAQVGQHLRLRGGVALQKSRIVANDNASFIGNRFANTPEHQVSLLASYTWAGLGLGQLTTDVGLTRIGQRWGNSGNTISLPGYTVVSLGASYRVAPATTVRLSVANATDQTYYTGMQDSGSRADQVMVGAKRNAYLTLTHSF
ncbi:MAG: TonB-dependent receptor [Hydrogenophaga sp.]|nr:TonB-dependent receptor [Hydrogenophaga sp.]